MTFYFDTRKKDNNNLKKKISAKEKQGSIILLKSSINNIFDMVIIILKHNLIFLVERQTEVRFKKNHLLQVLNLLRTKNKKNKKSSDSIQDQRKHKNPGAGLKNFMCRENLNNFEDIKLKNSTLSEKIMNSKYFTNEKILWISSNFGLIMRLKKRENIKNVLALLEKYFFAICQKTKKTKHIVDLSVICKKIYFFGKLEYIYAKSALFLLIRRLIFKLSQLDTLLVEFFNIKNCVNSFLRLSWCVKKKAFFLEFLNIIKESKIRLYFSQIRKRPHLEGWIIYSNRKKTN